jgi:hypothetical protein
MGLLKFTQVILHYPGLYTGLCFNCMISHDSVSQEDYARMAQEIVDQSLEP